MRVPGAGRFTLATRLTGAFVLSVAVAGGVAGLVFARTLQLGLDDGLDLGLRSRAQSLLIQFAPDGAGVEAAGATLAGTSGITQVIDANGRVLATSRAAGNVALFDARDRARAARGIYIIDATRDLPASAGSEPRSDEVRLLGAPLAGGNLIIVGAPEDTVADAVSETAAHLFVAGIIGLIFSGIGARLLIGAVLRPVETARRQVEAASLDEAAPVLHDPGGEDEFSRLVRTFNRLLRRQHELLEVERTFTADAGHELRTPLAILAGELELAARPTRTREEVTSALMVAKEETDRLVRLTEQLLTLARGDSDTLVVLLRGDLVPVVRAAVSSVRPLADERSIDITLDAPDRAPAMLDAERLRLAVENLLRNAVRYAPIRSSVGIRLSTVDGADVRWELRVRDRGPGFSEEFLPHAFDRFRRDDAARGRSDDDSYGAGLGLAIVRVVVAAHHGEPFAANRDDCPGADVGFDIPRLAEQTG